MDHDEVKNQALIGHSEHKV